MFLLHEQICEGRYTPKPSICFVVNKPVKREIFAADFRDRVVHHFIINKLNPLFEKQFIHDSYACRSSKGTHFGIQRVNRFIRRCSENYTKDCYILKLDISGFFTHINKDILLNRLEKFIQEKYHTSDKDLIIKLCHIVIFNDPTKNCIVKGDPTEWNGLPKSKSLFYSSENCGLPIGNLTSQIFANFYLDLFDHFVKRDLGIRFYGRYVDDFVLIHNDKEYLKSMIPKIALFLRDQLGLTLHPKKIYFQHYTKGVNFLGVVIKPNRIYIANRTKGNFYKTVQQWNKKIKISSNLLPEEEKAFLSSMNAYLGIMKHYKTYKIRKQVIATLDTQFLEEFIIVQYSLKDKKKVTKGKKNLRVIQNCFASKANVIQ